MSTFNGFLRHRFGCIFIVCSAVALADAFNENLLNKHRDYGQDNKQLNIASHLDLCDEIIDATCIHMSLRTA